jgi:hypothetical protein
MTSILRAIATKALRGEHVSTDERNLFNTYLRDHSLKPTVIQCSEHPIQAVLLMNVTEDASPFTQDGTRWRCHLCGTSGNVSVGTIASI